jgi:hypothetical protein
MYQMKADGTAVERLTNTTGGITNVGSSYR